MPFFQLFAKRDDGVLQVFDFEVVLHCP
jgi:hypothetical protein